MIYTPKQKEARLLAARNYYHRNKEKCLANSKEWNAKNLSHSRKRSLEYKRKNPIRLLLLNSRAAAKRKGVYFDITLEELEIRLKSMICEKTGLPLEFVYDGENKTHPWNPSIDRIDPKGVYTSDNIQIVCWVYNIAKNAWTDDVVLRMAEALVNNQK